MPVSPVVTIEIADQPGCSLRTVLARVELIRVSAGYTENGIASPSPGSRQAERTALPLDVLDQIDRICDRFEATWQAGERPRIEDFLGQVADTYRAFLLRDLLAAELNARRRLGEQPTPTE